MSNRNRGQLDRLHPSIRIDQRIQLRLHLARPGGVKPAPIDAPLDEPIHEERQLQRQSQSIALMPLQPLRQQARVVDVEHRPAGVRHVVAHGRAERPRRAPFGAEMVLHSEGDGHEDADGALDVGPLRGGHGRRGGVAVGEDGADQVADGGVHGIQAVAAVPEAVVGGLVPEDEHQTDDDGEGGDLYIQIHLY